MAAIFLLSTPMVSHSSTTISLFPNRPHQGDAVVVVVKGTSMGTPLRLMAIFTGSSEKKRVITLSPAGPKRATILGVPLDATGLVLRVKKPAGTQLAGVRVSLLARHVPISRLRLARRFLRPPKELQKRIARQRKMLRAILSRRSPYWLPRGLPVMPLSRYRETTPFGAKRVINGVKVSPHSGVDLAAPKGTPVRAPFSGRVVFAGRLYYTGNTVLLDHGRGFFTLYAHLSSFGVRVGELVGKGRVLGRVGSTGRVTGPHLHWGAYVCGVKVDPLSLFSIPSSLWAMMAR